jgi:hypothetical protein
MERLATRDDDPDREALRRQLIDEWGANSW